MTTPLTPILISEQLAICDAVTGIPYGAVVAGTAWADTEKFMQGAYVHYRAALEMAARVRGLEQGNRDLSDNAVEVGNLLSSCNAENAKLREALEKQSPIVTGTVSTCRNCNENAEKSYAAIRAQNAEITKLREALRFYGDEQSYRGIQLVYESSPVCRDRGERARKALGE